MNAAKCYVYILVEPDKFKIGKSISLIDRAKVVAPNVLWDQSTALRFDNNNDMNNCERALHWLFRAHRLAPIQRDGGTEFFSLECLSAVKQFIQDNKDSLGYAAVLNRSELDQERFAKAKQKITKPPTSSLATIDGEKLSIESGRSVLATLQELSAKGFLKGHVFSSNSLEHTSIEGVLVFVGKNEKDERDKIESLYDHGKIYCPRNSFPNKFFTSMFIKTNDQSVLGLLTYSVDLPTFKGSSLHRNSFGKVVTLIEGLPIITPLAVKAIQATLDRKRSINLTIKMFNDHESYSPPEPFNGVRGTTNKLPCYSMPVRGF